MQNVPKKKHAARRHSRILLLIFAVVLVAAAACLLIFARTPAPAPETPAHEDEEITLWAVESADITRIRIAVRNQEAWSAVQTESGALVLEGENAFTVDADIAATLLSGLKNVTAEVLSDDWNGTDEEWAAFGLDNPESVVTVDFADGSSHTLRIGSAPQYENSWQYAQLDGDTRLLSVSRGLAEECYVTRGSLHSVEQLTIHADRLDEITLLNAEGEITQQWRLNGAITNTDAQDRWMLTVPVSYPADGTAMTTLRKSAANIRLGEYIADATAESIAHYGLDTPRIVIRLHQAAGTIGAVGASGAYATTDYPESTITLVIGEQESELVDYVLYDGGIYRCSTLLLRGVMNADWQETITRYPVLTALGNLASLSRETADGVDTWVITRTEQVAENNELVTDDEGNQVYDITLTKNGESADYTAFSAAYNQLMMVTMSGRLPDDWTAVDAPHTVWTFTDIDGTVHTVALIRYDAMHDAVAVDGVALFYLIQGGFSLGI